MGDYLNQEDYLDKYKLYLTNKYRLTKNEDAKCKRCPTGKIEVKETSKYFELKCGNNSCDNFKINFPKYTSYSETLEMPDNPKKKRILKKWEKINDIQNKTKMLEENIKNFKNSKERNVQDSIERIQIEKNIIQLLKDKKKEYFIYNLDNRAKIVS